MGGVGGGGGRLITRSWIDSCNDCDVTATDWPVLCLGFSSACQSGHLTCKQLLIMSMGIRAPVACAVCVCVGTSKLYPSALSLYYHVGGESRSAQKSTFLLLLTKIIGLAGEALRTEHRYSENYQKKKKEKKDRFLKL